MIASISGLTVFFALCKLGHGPGDWLSWLEYLRDMQGVTGSSPVSPTRMPRDSYVAGFCCLVHFDLYCRQFGGQRVSLLRGQETISSMVPKKKSQDKISRATDLRTA
jgi:hypothetical protein